MKKALLGVAAMALFFAACKKDDDNSGTMYLNKIIGVEADGLNDTTLVIYNADNTLKELYGSSIDNGVLEFYAEGPVYQNGRIASVQERSTTTPVAHTVYSYVYTGSQLSRINRFRRNETSGQWEPGPTYDSIVYAGGKITEVHLLNGTDNSTKYALTWEGNNVKSVSAFSKQVGGNYTLWKVIKYSYDTKLAYHNLLTGNYLWMVEVTSFEYLSENNVVKEEVFTAQDVLTSTATNTYTYEGNLLKTLDEKVVKVDPARTDNFQTKFEYIKR